MIKYVVRPLSDKSWLNPAGRKSSSFTANWSSTLELLEREYDALRGRDLVIEVNVTERAIRNDGMLRGDARASGPAVVVAFESKHGPLLYRCDRYDGLPWGAQMRDAWQHNLRAIALTLESLRAIDRYGATETGQQYAGFKALPAGRAMPASHMTREEALAIFGIHGRAIFGMPPIPPEHINDAPDSLRSLYRAARRRAHPDRNNGDRTLWDQVEQAAKVLGMA